MVLINSYAIIMIKFSPLKIIIIQIQIFSSDLKHLCRGGGGGG